VSQDPVIILGAGLSGLAVAARLVSAGREVLVLEASSRAGGQIHTFQEGELIVELGAEGFVARSRSVPALCELLGIEGSLVDQLTTDTYAIEGAELVLLPPGEAARSLGFQVPKEELGRGIRSLAKGMGQLTDALLEHVGKTRVEFGAPVKSLRRQAQALAVELDNGRSLHTNTVVLAAPARIAASILEPLALPESEPLGSAPLTSNVSVNLLYRSAQFRDYPSGGGLIFPDTFANVGLRALSLVDHKFADRVPQDHALLRVFFRPVGDALTTWGDARFASEASLAIAQVLTVSGEPERCWVSRWTEALPLFTPEYQIQAAAVDRALQALSIHVTGSAFHGAGIDAAVASAEVVAARLGA